MAIWHHGAAYNFFTYVLFDYRLKFLNFLGWNCFQNRQIENLVRLWVSKHKLRYYKREYQTLSKISIIRADRRNSINDICKPNSLFLTQAVKIMVALLGFAMPLWKMTTHMFVETTYTKIQPKS